MILPDANLLLYAYDSASPFHARCKAWWEKCLSGTEPVALCPVVLFAFVRLATHPRVFENPMPIATAAGHVTSWLERRVVQFVPMEETDAVMALKLLQHAGTGGDLATDAQIAAIALRLGAVLHTADTDFQRFPGLKLFNPLKVGSH